MDRFTEGEITTKYGKLTLTITDGNHIRIHNDVKGSKTRHTLTIRKQVIDHVNIHVYRKVGTLFDVRREAYNQATWGTSEKGALNWSVIRNEIHMTRRDFRYPKDMATNNQKEKLYVELLPLVEAWVKEHSDAFKEAEQGRLQDLMDGKREEIREAREALEKVEREFADLLKQAKE